MLGVAAKRRKEKKRGVAGKSRREEESGDSGVHSVHSLAADSPTDTVHHHGVVGGRGEIEIRKGSSRESSSRGVGVGEIGSRGGESRHLDWREGPALPTTRNCTCPPPCGNRGGDGGGP